MSEFGLITPHIPKTVEHSSTFESVQRYNGEIGFATPANVERLIKPNTELLVKMHLSSSDEWKAQRLGTVENIRGNFSVSSTSKPAILFEEGASFCSLLLSFNEVGNAVLMHRSMIYSMGYEREEKQEKEALQNYKDLAKGALGDTPNFMIVSGTNIIPKETPDLRQKLLEFLEQEFPNQDMSTLFIKQEESFYRERSPWEIKKTTLVDWFYNKLTKKQESAVPANLRTISGMIYIRRQLSRDDRNHILIKGGSETREEKLQMIDALLPQRGKLLKE